MMINGVVIGIVVGYGVRSLMHLYAKQLRRFKRRCRRDAEVRAAASYRKYSSDFMKEVIR